MTGEAETGNNLEALLFATWDAFRFDAPTLDFGTSLYLYPSLSNTGATKAWDGELQAYRDARSQGIQPSGTTMAKIREAEEISQRTGQAYKGA